MAFPQLVKSVFELYALVGDAFVGSTEALLYGDRMIAEKLIERDQLVDNLYAELDQELAERLSKVPLSADEISYLVGLMKIVPELERSGDLAEHIAQKSLLGLGPEMSPRLRGIVNQMSKTAAEMWRRSAEAFLNSNKEAHRVIDALDDEIDELNLAYYTELASSCKDVVPAIELALVGRFYERFADHAVNLARTVAQLPDLR
ncbi:phosphate transport system protein [Ferrithrix thermotolerans DSM 19514]|uniref:Phosphate transport system protein n=1 Tax=Ferrithrix thermotolerans DSM 19514 TaxID=1121881 RepID=A0A1M4WTW4_9ACTN|nr:PhoU domain-containing protein [Ferrithrix thermotolerans]SHE84650.1 phosphate transport system protein [Ferrithrix thermotolerans DSM 19514]